MSRFASDGMVRVDFALTVADMTAPTVAELAAGTPLASFIPKDGLTVPADQNNTPDDALADIFDGQVPGTFGGIISLTMKRDNADDTAWDLVEYGLEGFIVVRRGVPSEDDWAADDAVEVYPGAFHEPAMMQTASNEQARFTAAFPVRSPGPELKATVAA